MCVKAVLRTRKVSKEQDNVSRILWIFTWKENAGGSNVALLSLEEEGSTVSHFLFGGKIENRLCPFNSMFSAEFMKL